MAYRCLTTARIFRVCYSTRKQRFWNQRAPYGLRRASFGKLTDLAYRRPLTRRVFTARVPLKYSAAAPTRTFGTLPLASIDLRKIAAFLYTSHGDPLAFRPRI